MVSSLPPPPHRAEGGAAKRGGLLSGAFRLYFSNWLVLVGISALVVIPASLASSAIFHGLFGDAVLFRRLPGNRIETGPDFGKALAVTFALGILTLIVTQLATGATTRAAIVATAGGKPTVGDSYRVAGRVLGSLLLVSLLSALVVFGGFLLLIIPGIIFAIRLVATVPVVVAEDVRGTEALRRSWRLVKGDGWNVFGVLLVAGLLSGVVSAVVTAPFTNGEWFQIGVANAIASTLTTPFITCVIVLIYLDLRARKEGLDREALARELGGSAPSV